MRSAGNIGTYPYPELRGPPPSEPLDLAISSNSIQSRFFIIGIVYSNRALLKRSGIVPSSTSISDRFVAIPFLVVVIAVLKTQIAFSTGTHKLSADIGFVAIPFLVVVIAVLKTRIAFSRVTHEHSAVIGFL